MIFFSVIKKLWAWWFVTSAAGWTVYETRSSWIRYRSDCRGCQACDDRFAAPVFGFMQGCLGGVIPPLGMYWVACELTKNKD
jgi:hypothetical protein